DNGLGAILAPAQIRRLGKAETDVEVDRTAALAQAEQLAADIRAGRKQIDHKRQIVDVEPEKQRSALLTPQEVIERASSIESERSLKRLSNLSRIAAYAADEAEQSDQQPDASDKTIDSDWFAQWRNGAQDVSSEQMQQLWARILAGEVAQ